MKRPLTPATAAAPGLEVLVDSEWGHGSTVIGEDGTWRIEVKFPDAPIDEEFRVKVKSSSGDRAGFWFVRTGDEKWPPALE